MALRSLEIDTQSIGHAVRIGYARLWAGPRLDSPPNWNLQKLDLVRMGAPSPESGHGQPRHWTRQNWTRNTKLDTPRPTRNCASNFAFSDPKSDTIFGIIGRVKTDTECDLKKIGRNPIFRQCVQFFILVSFPSIKNWTRALSKIGRTKKLDAGFKKRKLDAPFWA